MRIGAIVLRLRAAQTEFGNFIGGCAELSLALNNTLLQEMAFVVPLSENASETNIESEVQQYIIERFGVIIALKNDTAQSDKLGLIAYDRIHDIRSQILKALVGITLPDAIANTYYRGGRLIDINPAWLWYQFEFETKTILNKIQLLDNGLVEYGINGINYNYENAPDEWTKIYTKYVLQPSKDLPFTGDFESESEMASLALPEIGQFIDMTQKPYDGDFIRFDFGSDFKFFNDKEFDRSRK